MIPIVDYESFQEYLVNISGLVINANSVPLLKRFCVTATDLFNQFTGRVFVPERATYYADHPTYDPRQIDLDKDLLELIEFTTENGATEIPTADFLLRAGKSANFTPYDNLVLKRGSDYSFGYEDDPENANAITGIWGYHDDWANAWELSGDTVQDSPLLAAATTLTVGDADGLDINGLSNRFRVQQLLRIEDEYLFVTAKDTGTNVLTVRRGMNGTTAAQHAQSTPIYIYRPMPALVNAMWVLATYQHNRRHSIATGDDRPLATAQGILLLPSKLPGEVENMLAHYKRLV